jgi:DNA-directed RNA polymerase specialized sigma24 family protein
MKKNWALSQEALDTLLDWLNPDRDQAGLKYEEIRRRLVTIFTGRGWHDAEDLADETINRVASLLPERKDKYSGDPALFFYSVANNVHRERWRKRLRQPLPLVNNDSDDREERFRCLEECLAVLTPENRELVLEYYQEDKQAKIDRRKLLAERLGIAPNALRIRACRIRAALEKCLKKCLDHSVS